MILKKLLQTFLCASMVALILAPSAKADVLDVAGFAVAVPATLGASAYTFAAYKTLRASLLLRKSSEYKNNFLLSFFNGFRMCTWGEGGETPWIVFDESRGRKGLKQINNGHVHKHLKERKDFQASLVECARLKHPTSRFFLVALHRQIRNERRAIESLRSGLLLAQKIGFGFRSSAQFWLEKMDFYSNWLGYLAGTIVRLPDYEKQVSKYAEWDERVYVPNQFVHYEVQH